MEAETKATEVIQKIEDLNMEDVILQKLDEIKLEVDENPETVTKVSKRGSLSKFFRFMSKSTDNINAESSPKPIPKSNTLMRMFSSKKKTKDAEKDEVQPEATARRSTIMRGLVNCQIVPWMSRQPSQMNIHKPIENVGKKDDAPLHELATSSEMF